VKCLICVPLWTNIRYATDTEAKVNALDRLNQFAELPPEASCFDTGSGLMDSSFTQNKVYWCVVCYVVVLVVVFFFLKEDVLLKLVYLVLFCGHLKDLSSQITLITY
jgi:hypothetical protein